MSSGLHLFGHRREPADVDEQDRDLDAASAEGESRSCEVVRHRGRWRTVGSISACWSRNRFFSSDASSRARSRTALTGLAEVVLGPQLEAPDDVVEALERRRDDDGDVAEGTILLELGEHLEPVHLRHLDVEEHEVEVVVVQPGECEPAVLGRLDVMTLQLERACQEQSVHLVVVDHEHTAGMISHRRASATLTSPVRRQPRVDRAVPFPWGARRVPARGRGRRARPRRTWRRST